MGPALVGLVVQGGRQALSGSPERSGCKEKDQGVVGAQRRCLAQFRGPGALQEASVGLRGGIGVRQGAVFPFSISPSLSETPSMILPESSLPSSVK